MTATVSNSTASISSTGGGGGGVNGGAVTQSFALSNTWSFNHNLNTHYPVVTVYNENKEVIIPTNIVSKTNNQIEVLFSTQASGSVAVVSGFNTGSGGTPGGSNTQIQFNDSNTFGGSPNLTFTKTDNRFRISGSAQITGSATIQTVAGVNYNLIDAVSAVTNVSALSVTGVSVTGLQPVIDALSNEFSVVTLGIASVDNRVSIVSTNVTNLSNTVSNLTSIVNAVSNRVSNITSQLVSINDRVSAVSVVASNLGSIVTNVSAVSYTTNTTGTAVTALQTVVNTLSARAGAQVSRFVSVAQSVSATTLTGISGLTISVSAGDLLQIEAMFMYSVTDTTGNQFGLTFPAATNMAGQYVGATSVNQAGPATVSTLVIGDFDTGDSNIVLWSAGVGPGLHMIRMNALYQVSTAGTMFPSLRVSATTNTTVLHRGSFFRVLKLN